jgi:hypothetical protein
MTFLNRPLCVLEMNRFRWVCRQGRLQSFVEQERVEACPPKSVHFQGAVGHTIGLPFSWILLFGKKRSISHTDS